VDVRLPSMLASLLAVVVMLAMVRAGVSPRAVLFAAAIMAISASQVRYAQEVREYSLAALFAGLMIYALLRWESQGKGNRPPVWLYLALFFAPLVQYGLVFLGAAVLATIALRILLTRGTAFRPWHLITGAACLAAGALVSFGFTLRYQFHPGQGQWYLAANYFDPKTTSLVHFLAANTKGLLSFLIPGQVIAVCFVLAATLFCGAQLRTRKIQTITWLALNSLAITSAASLLRLYPYGGIRQCLFLSPVIILFAGVAFAESLQRLSPSLRPPLSVAFMAVILLSGYRGLLKQWPYGEYEDTNSILRQLAKSSAPQDEIWVNHDAAEAVSFYRQSESKGQGQNNDPRFVYGQFHKNPQEYLPELKAEIDPHEDRVWLVFSHLEQPSDRSEEELIINSLGPGWDVRRVIEPTNAALYVAHRIAAH
jgi:uncharacterized membrane protein